MADLFLGVVEPPKGVRVSMCVEGTPKGVRVSMCAEGPPEGVRVSTNRGD